MTSTIKIAVVLAILLLARGVVGYEGVLQLTTLERSDYKQLTASSEISAFLSILSHKHPSAEKLTIATSARGNPVDALLVSSDVARFKEGDRGDDKLTVMLVGSQHGNETSGAEALLLVVRDMLEGRLGAYLEHMNLIVIPNSNPDGRNLGSRRNANGADINRNYTVLSEAESKGIVDAMHRWKPEVVLDVHEAAALKKKTLAREGYLTGFEAQFEAANNPNVDKRIRTYSFNHLLPQILDKVNSQGLTARRYIKSIKSIHQPVTHGGLSLSILRNMAGMRGSFSFLLENRLEPSTGAYRTPQNIRIRVSKQYLCITTFLNCCRIHRAEIKRISRHARMKWKNPQNKEPLYLNFSYAADANKPEITLPLRRIDTGEPIQHTFPYHGTVVSDTPLSLPTCYIITTHQNLLRNILARHHVNFRKAEKRGDIVVRIKRIKNRIFETLGNGRRRARYTFKERTADYHLRPGDLVVTMNQPLRKLFPLLLEFRSFSSIFNTGDYRHLVENQKDFFVLPAE
jgi:hypothetical protein